MANYNDKRIEQLVGEMRSCMDEDECYKAFYKANDTVIAWIKEYTDPKVSLVSIRTFIKEYNQVMQFCEPMSPGGDEDE